MQNIQIIAHKQPIIGCAFQQGEIVSAQWAGCISFWTNSLISKTEPLRCTSLIKISRDTFMATTTRGDLVLFNSVNESTTTKLRSGDIMISGYCHQTQLFMHNTIQQQRFLNLLCMRTMEKKGTYEHPTNITSLCPLQSGFLIGDQDGYVTWLNKDCQVQNKIKFFSKPISHLKSMQSQLIVVSQSDLKIVKNFRVLKSISGPAEISCCEIYANKLYIGNINGEVSIMNNYRLETTKAHESTITSMDFDNNRMATASSDKLLKIWQL